MSTNLPAAPATVLTVQAAVASATSERQPIPDLHVVLVGIGSTGDQQAMAVTDAAGKTTASVSPGKYRLFTPRAVRREGRWYTWDFDLSLTAASAQLELSERNAIIIETDGDGSSTTTITVTPQEERATASQPASSTSAGVSPSSAAESPADTAPLAIKQERHIDSKPLAGYDRVIVRSIPVANSPGTTELRGPEIQLLHKLLISKLQKSKIFADVQDATERSGSERVAAELAPKTLELLGTVVDFRRGERIKRGTLGIFGAGVTRMKVQFSFRDMATGTPVLAVKSEGSGAAGFLLGGDDEQNASQAVRQVVEKLLASIKRHRQ